MSALRKQQRVLSGLGLIGNFIERPLRVGDIVLNDDGQHLIWGNIGDVIDGLSIEDLTVVSNASDLKYTSESSVEILIGGNVGSTVAKGEIELKFNAKNSAFIYFKQIKRSSLKLGLIDVKLKEYWRKKGFDKPSNRNKYHFIAEVIDADSGTMIFSQDKSNKVVLTGKNNTPLTSLEGFGEGRIEFVTNTKSTLEIISQTPIQPLYTAIRYRANGNFEIVG